jgi:transglutaminase-like putative cysteine protease
MTTVERRKTIVLLVGLVILSVVFGTFLTIYLIQVIVPDYPPQLDVQLNKLLQIWNPNSTHELPYQDYITPSDLAVKQLSDKVDGRIEAYNVAVGWVWVSDVTLNDVTEKWLMPHTFLVDTPYYPTNPAKPREASDCEEQANTLVSLLRAEGVEAKNVRVVLGIVNIEGTEGGHAWVEVYEDNQWLALETTTGPFYDDDSLRLRERRGLPYNFYRTHTYPSVEIWFYYNDIYYMDFIHDKQNAPSHWLMIKAANNFVININEITHQFLTFYFFTWLIFCSFRLSSHLRARLTESKPVK